MWLDDLVTLFVTGGAATARDTDVFTSSRSSPPALAGGTITLIDTGGSGSERTNTTRVAGGTVQAVTSRAYERPSALVIIRAPQKSVALAKAWEAYNAADGVRNTFINSGFYREINVTQEPFEPGGPNDRDEARYHFNVTAIKRPSAH